MPSRTMRLADLLNSPLQQVLQNPRPAPATATVASYTPPVSQRVGARLGDLAARVGGDRYWGTKVGNRLADVLSFIGVDAPGQIMDARQQYGVANSTGDRAAILASAILAGADLAPGVGKARKARKLADLLPMDEASRLARARAMGFDTATPFYRGLSRPYSEADTGAYQLFTSSPEDASEYAGAPFSGANVLPAFVRPGRNATVDAGGANWNAIPRAALPEDIQRYLHPSVGDVVRTDEFAHAAKLAGYDSATIQNVYDNVDGVIRNKPRQRSIDQNELDAIFAELEDFMAPAAPSAAGLPDELPRNYDPVTIHAAFDPKNIRSRFAAFDPLKRNSANLMAGTVAGVIGYGALAPEDPANPRTGY